MGLNLRTKHDDGRLGWPENAPFDAIIVTAAGAALDDALLAQLAEGGTLVAPVGPANATQALLRIRKTPEGVLRENLGAVVFVPLLPGTT
jgi:protein-L-isoaspartate(D-aspartate) O-methyltransferase